MTEKNDYKAILPEHKTATANPDELDGANEDEKTAVPEELAILLCAAWWSTHSPSRPSM